MRRHLIAAVVIAGLSLTACGSGTSGADPQAEASVRAPAPTLRNDAAPTPSASEPPSPIRLEDFAARWVKASFYMQRTGKSARYRKFVAPTCEACAGYSEFVEAVYANGGWIKIDRLDFTKISKVRKSGNTTTFLLTTEASPTTYAEGPDAPEESLPGGPEVLSVTVERRANGLRVTHYSNATRQ